MSRYLHNGASKPTTLNGAINSAVTTLTVNDGSTYPSGGAFWIVVDAGLSTEEHILVGSRTGNVFSALTRGGDNTSAFGHNDKATVVHALAAVEADDANALVQRAPAGTATLATLTDTQTFTNKTHTSPTINGGTQTGVVLDATSTIGGVSGTSLAADRAAWNSYTPTFTNAGQTGGTYHYHVEGKKLYFWLGFATGSITANATSWSASLPGGITAATGAANTVQAVTVFQNANGSVPWQAYVQQNTTTIVVQRIDGAAIAAGTLVGVSLSGVIEVQ